MNMPEPLNCQIMNGSKASPTQIDNLKLLVVMMTIPIMARLMAASVGIKARSTPRVVAAPLPPLNFRKTDQLCPSTAAKPATNEIEFD